VERINHCLFWLRILLFVRLFNVNLFFATVLCSRQLYWAGGYIGAIVASVCYQATQYMKQRYQGQAELAVSVLPPSIGENRECNSDSVMHVCMVIGLQGFFINQFYVNNLANFLPQFSVK